MLPPSSGMPENQRHCEQQCTGYRQPEWPHSVPDPSVTGLEPPDLSQNIISVATSMSASGKATAACPDPSQHGQRPLYGTARTGSAMAGRRTSAVRQTHNNSTVSPGLLLGEATPGAYLTRRCGF